MKGHPPLAGFGFGSGINKEGYAAATVPPTALYYGSSSSYNFSVC